MKNKVRFYREQHNLTQTELAEKSGVSLRTIQRIENGNKLKGFTLESIAKALKIEPQNLLSEKIDLEKIKMINFTALSFFLLPFGNIIIPVILTYKSQNEKTKSLGKDIVNTQVIWTIVTSILLILSPFIQRILPFEFPLIIIVFITLICINLYIIFKNAMSLTNNSELYIHPKIKLL